MKTFILLSIFLSLNIVSHVSALTDYCAICAKHVACNNTGAFAPTCPADRAVVPFTQADKDLFVQVHNELRNKIAGGNVPGYSSAANMSSVTWDDELATLAELNVKKCKMQHDDCIKTIKYPWAGQNLYVGYGTFKVYPDINTVIAPAVNLWFNEYLKASAVNMTLCCFGNEKIGHFTQVVQYRVVAIGCAAVRATIDGWKNTFIACNYSYGNMSKAPVYIAGPPASGCKTGKHPIYTNLCK